MVSKKVSEISIKKFKIYLMQQERSVSTIQKYERDIRKFYTFLGEDKEINKEVLLAYKYSLNENYKASSMNSMLVAVNSFLKFLGLNSLKINIHKIQKRMFSDQNKELTKKEYQRLLEAANTKENERLYMLIQAICGTGIRVSEHKYITIEAVKEGRAVVENKGKIREIYFSKKLRKALLSYSKKQGISEGSIFVTSSKKPLDRSNIWKMMKDLCERAKVDKSKVFPHNLRHLFAFTFYSIEKDLVKLAGILGHSSIETTRIYTMSSGNLCTKTLSKMDLVLGFL